MTRDEASRRIQERLPGAEVRFADGKAQVVDVLRDGVSVSDATLSALAALLPEVNFYPWKKNRFVAKMASVIGAASNPGKTSAVLRRRGCANGWPSAEEGARRIRC